jgi:hypothetical protein
MAVFLTGLEAVTLSRTVSLRRFWSMSSFVHKLMKLSHIIMFVPITMTNRFAGTQNSTTVLIIEAM